jgi:hypothetical protein
MTTTIATYNESYFRKELNLTTRKKNIDGETFHLVSHKRKGNRSGYAIKGDYGYRDMEMDITYSNLYCMINSFQKSTKRYIPKDIVTYIESFICYLSNDEVQYLNSITYLTAFYKNSIYNSALFNEKGNMVCISQPKPMFSSLFCKQFQHDIENITFYEMIEGTMINAFYYNGQWRLSTKYYIEGSSEEMHQDIVCFKETCKALGVNLNDCLDTDMCYSFVFRHPGIVHVNQYDEDKYAIYIVALYKIDNENNKVIHCDLGKITAYKYTYCMPCYNKNRTILIPEEVVVNFNDLEMIVKEWGVGDGIPSEVWENDCRSIEGRYFRHGSMQKGIMMYHKPSGIRTEVLNRNYLYYLYN